MSWGLWFRAGWSKLIHEHRTEGIRECFKYFMLTLNNVTTRLVKADYTLAVRELMVVKCKI